MPISDAYLPLDVLLPDTANYNRHAPEQVAVLASQIQAVGFTAPFLVDAATKTIAAGHRRRLALLKLRGDGHAEPEGVQAGWLVPCRVGEWSEIQRLKVLIGDNPDPARLDYDTERLTALLSELSNLGELEGSGYDESRLETLIEELAEQASESAGESGLLEGADPDAVPESAPQRCRPKDLWQLGQHRLLCGDSTNPEDVARLMRGEEAHLLWADPPFGINYTGHGESKDGRAHKFQAIKGDDRPIFEWLPLCAPVEGGAIYLKTTWAVLHEWEKALASVCRLRSRIVWDKCSHVAGDVVGGYATRAEIILFGSIGAHKIARFDTDVWEIPRATTGAPETRTGHPYESPVALPARAIENSTTAGQCVLDPYLGSGSTLIAAEQLDRRCYGIEIEPRFADIILTRWEAATGKTAALLEREED